jgi:hypothetical protein
VPPHTIVPEAVANALLCAALAVPPAPAADVAKRPRDAEAGPSAPPKVPKQRAAKGQSDGVNWNKQRGKWIGQVSDPSRHYSNGKAKLLSTKCFKERAACVEARAALLEETNTKNAARLAAMAAADPTTRGLPLRPERAGPKPPWDRARTGNLSCTRAAGVASKSRARVHKPSWTIGGFPVCHTTWAH